MAVFQPELDRANIKTKTKGKVVIELRPDLAPNHVARIKELARSGFYDGVVFHRVIEGFMAQTGDPTGTGSGGMGEMLKSEFSKEPQTLNTIETALPNDVVDHGTRGDGNQLF